MARDVFISHSAQDRAAAETIRGALEKAAIRCWVAPRDVRPGHSFPGEITRAIQQCKVMLLIFSQHSNSSEQVLREIQLAVDCHLPIVRLRIEDVKLSDDLRYYLSTPHWLDALTSPLSKHIPPLEAALRELLGQSAEESEKNATAEAPARTEVTAKNKPAAPGQKSPTNWKPIAIVTALLLVGALAVILAWRFARTNQEKNVAAATPTATAQPTSTVLAQVTPTPEPVRVAVLPSPSATVKPESTTTPGANQASKKEPLARNNRTWQAWMDEFVHNFIASNETNDVDLAVSFYAQTVDLFEEGKKSADAIRRDVESYNARWPSRRATIRGDVRLNEKAPNRTYTASFEHDYYVENASRGEWINGAVAVDLQIIVADGGIPRIAGEKQKTLRREKGTMQPR